ncbi:MAG: hypothetical protein R3B96_06165 [Pirellulaceae bacterium]
MIRGAWTRRTRNSQSPVQPRRTRATDLGDSRRYLGKSLDCQSLGLAFLVLGASFLGCQGESQTAWQTSAGPAPTANELVERVRAAYRQAPQYGDRGMLLMTYTLQGAPQQERHPMSTVFDRDQASDLQAFALRAHWAESTQHIAVFDPTTQNLGGQIVVRPQVPFGQQCEWPEDNILRHFATGRAELPLGTNDVQDWLTSLPLALARDAQQQPWFLGERELLDASFLDGRECYRLRVNTPLGRCLVWIDVKEYLVLRVELPMSLLDSRLLAQGGVTDPRLVLDLADAQWNVSGLEERLSFTPPADARRVTHFVSLPTPFPSETIGRKPGEATLAGPDGSPLETQSLAGTTTSLFWFSSDPVCRGPLREFISLAQQNSQVASVRFLAICTDPPSSLNAQALDQLLRSWQVDPKWIYRDPYQAGKTAFDVRLLPTMEVLSADGRVQFYKVIDDGKVAAELAAVLNRLDNGEEIAAEMRTEYRNYLTIYEGQVLEAAYNRDEIIALRNASFAPRRLPERFGVTSLGEAEATSSGTLTAPGNFGVIQREDRAEVAILDGFQSLCLLDDQGAVTRRIELGSDALDNYTQVRGWHHESHAYWAVGSILGSRIKLVVDGTISATIDVDPRTPIRDWTLADLDANGGIPELWVATLARAGS